MAQESREWYTKDSDHEAGSPGNNTPSGQFKGEEIEFESFMFDGGQGSVAELFRSGPLSDSSLGASSATIKMSSGPLAATMVAPETPGQRTPSKPLPPLTDSGSLRAGPQGGAKNPSTPLTSASSEAAGPPHFSGSIAPPQSAPLRQSGPFVDGRTSISGPTTSGSLSSGSLQSNPLSTGPTPSGQFGSTGPMGTGTGPLGQRNTGPLSQGMVDRAQSASPTQSGQLNGNGHSKSRLSGLLSQQQLDQTGPLKTANGNSAPLTESQPSRLTQSGPLTPADLPSTPAPAPPTSNTASGPLSEQSGPAPMSMSMFSKGAWSDTSLAAVEDFSSLLLAMDGARRYMTSGTLNSGLLTTSPTIRDMSSLHDSSVLYNNTAPAVHNTGTQPEYVADTVEASAVPADEPGEAVEAAAPAVAYDDVPDILDETEAPFDPMAWIEEADVESWNAEAMMPAVDAPPSDMSPSDEMQYMEADQEMTLEAPSDLHTASGPMAEMGDMYEAASPEDVVDFEVPVQTPAPVELDEGKFAGQSLEFEGFMFNGGRISTPDLVRMVKSGTEVVSTPPPVMQAPAVPVPSTESASSDDLPFWLRPTGELNLSQTEIAGEQEAPAVQMAVGPQAMTDDYIDYSDLPPIDPFDFGSLGLSVEEDEGLGFNTQELSGYSGTNYELMTATADLQVVADILGTDPGLAVVPSELIRPQMITAEAESASESAAEAPSTSALADDSLDGNQATLTLDPNSTHQLDAQPPRSWTATVTSTLSADALPGAPKEESDKPAKPGTVLLNEQAPTITEGLGVTPFDFSDLDLDVDDEEQITELLNVPRVRNTGPLHAIAASDMPYSVPGQPAQSHDEGRAGSHQPPASSRKWATSWLGDTASQLSSFLDKPAADAPAQADPEPVQTAPEPMQAVAKAAPAPEPEIVEETLPPEFSADMNRAAEEVEPESEPILSFMRDDSLQTGSLALDEVEDTQESEQVAREMPSEPVYNFAADAAQGDPVATWEPDNHVETYAESTEDVPVWDADRQPQAEQLQPYTEPHTASVTTDSYPYQPMTPLHQPQPQPQFQAQPQPAPAPQPQVQARTGDGYGQVQPTRFPTSILTSGPLPSLDGFEELHELVNSNPDDVGAHMALAAAYSQVGDADTQLRVYRRVLRKQNVSNKILRLIAEELTDYEGTLTGHPHFHQVRGDLYMKQNRYQEAIAEYNKIV